MYVGSVNEPSLDKTHLLDMRSYMHAKNIHNVLLPPRAIFRDRAYPVLVVRVIYAWEVIPQRTLAQRADR
jgi:hypothetical protein